MFEMQYFLASAPAVIAFVKALPLRAILGRSRTSRLDRDTSRPAADPADAQARHLNVSS